MILVLLLLEAHPAAKSALIALDNQATIQALKNNRTQPAQHLLDYVVIKDMHIHFISIIKEKKTKKDIHQEMMNAWWHI